MMNDLIAKVIETRKREAEVKRFLQESYQAWEDANVELLSLKVSVIRETQEAEAALRDAAILYFRDTGEKHPAPGVEVKLRTELSYYPAEALKWGYEHGVSLQLNKSIFEKLAKADLLPFVEVEQVPFGTIAVDLENLMGKER